MSWGSWQAFWAMGGYGGYVWGAYATVALVVLGEAMFVRARLARARRNAAGTRKRRP
jgi:heme exporter protein D